jgi:CheY-like chemotaxis protein
MGGHIHVKSKLGQGSTFIFELPFHGKIGGMSTSHRTTTTVSTLGDVGKNKEGAAMKTILVAEDEESNYELVRIVLQKRYRLVRARNGIEAVTINEDEKPDMILMDIRMPEMNGLDATRIIKEVSSDTPVVALSAYAFEENVREAKAAGCDDFLAKPFKVENLIEVVRKYLND